MTYDKWDFRAWVDKFVENVTSKSKLIVIEGPTEHAGYFYNIAVTFSSDSVDKYIFNFFFSEKILVHVTHNHDGLSKLLLEEKISDIMPICEFTDRFLQTIR